MHMLRNANIMLTTQLMGTDSKAKAFGITKLVQTDTSIKIDNMELKQTDCNSSIFIYGKLRLTNVCVTHINRENHSAHLKATIELFEPKSEQDADVKTSAGWFSATQSFFISQLAKVAPTTEEVD